MVEFFVEIEALSINALGVENIPFMTWVRIPYQNITGLTLMDDPSGSNDEFDSDIDLVDWEATGMALEDLYNEKDIDPFSAEGQKIWDDKFLEKMKDMVRRNNIKIEEKNISMKHDGSIKGKDGRYNLKERVGKVIEFNLVNDSNGKSSLLLHGMEYSIDSFGSKESEIIKIIKKVAEKYDLTIRNIPSFNKIPSIVVEPSNNFSISQKQRLGGTRGIIGGQSYQYVNSFRIAQSSRVISEGIKLMNLEGLLSMYIEQEINRIKVEKELGI